MNRGRTKTKKAARNADIAAEAWRLMLDFSFAQRNRLTDVLEELGLTHGDMKALLVLEPDEPRPMGSLAQTWACDASNATWIIDRLEERGLVERRMLPADRRVKAVALTPRGVKMKAELLKRWYEPPADLLALDRATLETLRDALARLSEETRSGRFSQPAVGAALRRARA